MKEATVKLELPELVPGATRHALFNYIANHVRPGGFLRAVLENDLEGALRQADPANMAALRDIVRWLHWDAPARCWGSREAVAKWLGESA